MGLVRVELWSPGEDGQLIRQSYYRHLTDTPETECGVSGHYQLDDTISVCVCIKYVSHFQYYLLGFVQTPPLNCQ